MIPVHPLLQAVADDLRATAIGWMLWRTAGPPVRHPVRTTAQFVPTGSAPPGALLGTFDRLQDEQRLYACLTILAPHQERHLRQAEQVLERLRGGK